MEEIKRTANDKLVDSGLTDDNDIIIFDSPSYDDALLGVIEIEDRLVPVYDFDKMIEWLVENDWCGDESEAADFICYNNSFRQHGQPVILYPVY